MKPFVAYTCVIGGYDQLQEGGAPASAQAAPDAKFLYFSDQSNARLPEPWQVRPLSSPPELQTAHAINRYHKFFPHRVLPECEVSIYHDGNIRFDADYATLVARLRSLGAAVGAFRHPAKRSLNDELAACVAQDKLDANQLATARDQLARYAAEGFDCDAVISANYLLVRDHSHPALDQAMTLWWEQITTHAPRDQLSLGYALATAGLPFAFLDDSSNTSGVVPPVRAPHRGERRRKRWRRLRSLVAGRSAKIGVPARGSDPTDEQYKQ